MDSKPEDNFFCRHHLSENHNFELHLTNIACQDPIDLELEDRQNAMNIAMRNASLEIVQLLSLKPSDPKFKEADVNHAKSRGLYYFEV